jgi:hypothetical protein
MTGQQPMYTIHEGMSYSDYRKFRKTIDARRTQAACRTQLDIRRVDNARAYYPFG